VDCVGGKSYEAIEKRTTKLIEKGIVDNEQVENTTFSDSAIDLLDCVEILLKNYNNKPNAKDDFSSFINYIRQMLNTKEKRGAIELTSIHQAKGKEWDRVFILNDAKVFYEYAKTPDQIQQEKNLSYVAVTRSKDTLYLVHENKEEDIDQEDDWLNYDGIDSNNMPDLDEISLY
jgi:superfamily I DNA/RNA helicase